MKAKDNDLIPLRKECGGIVIGHIYLVTTSKGNKLAVLKEVRNALN